MLIVIGGTIAGLFLLAIVNQTLFYVGVVLIVPIGITIVGYDVGATTLLQIGSDDANRGRVSALMQTAMAASGLVAIGFTSLLADQVGAVVLLNLSAILFVLAGLVGILMPRGVQLPNSRTPGSQEMAAQRAE